MRRTAGIAPVGTPLTTRATIRATITASTPAIAGHVRPAGASAIRFAAALAAGFAMHATAFGLGFATGFAVGPATAFAVGATAFAVGLATRVRHRAQQRHRAHLPGTGRAAPGSHRRTGTTLPFPTSKSSGESGLMQQTEKFTRKDQQSQGSAGRRRDNQGKDRPPGEDGAWKKDAQREDRPSGAKPAPARTGAQSRRAREKTENRVKSGKTADGGRTTREDHQPPHMRVWAGTPDARDSRPLAPPRFVHPATGPLVRLGRRPDPRSGPPQLRGGREDRRRGSVLLGATGPGGRATTHRASRGGSAAERRPPAGTEQNRVGRARSAPLTGLGDQNCALSVEPSSAVVEESGLTAVLMRSK